VSQHLTLDFLFICLKKKKVLDWVYNSVAECILIICKVLGSTPGT
jgi:hypothetical protein